MEDSLEEWKEIPDYNGRYFASTFGRIKSVKGNILKPFIGTGGYMYVAVSKNPNQFKSKRLHRLIAITFIPNPNNYSQINHIDENKLNNCVNNLEWCTGSYNMNYGHRKEKFFNSNKNCKSLSKEVCQYSLEGKFIRIFPSAKEASRFLNRPNCKTTATRICNCCKQIYKTGNSCYGYLWRFRTDFYQDDIPKLTKKGISIIQYDLNGNYIKTWDTIMDAVNGLNLHRKSIGNITRSAKSKGERTAFGYKWKYVND